MAAPNDHVVAQLPTRIAPVRHYGQWISAVLVIIVLVLLAQAVITNDAIRWSVIDKYFFSSNILSGLWTTIWLTIASMAVGIAGGIVVASMRMSQNAVFRAISNGYIWLFRGTPLLVQILIWFNFALFFPVIGYGAFSISTNSLITPAAAALFALALNEIAYMAEIVRGGILAVASGQREAGAALGMPEAMIMRRVVLPQALKVIIPPTGNELITLLKMTSLVAVIGAGDLLTQAQSIGTRDFTPMEMLIVASIWYLLLTTIATSVQHLLEDRLLRGSGTPTQPSFLRQLTMTLVPGRAR